MISLTAEQIAQLPAHSGKAFCFLKHRKQIGTICELIVLVVHMGLFLIKKEKAHRTVKSTIFPTNDINNMLHI